MIAKEGEPDMSKLLLTVPEAAAALAISRSKLYELIAARVIRSVRIDGSRRVPVEVLEAYVAGLLAEEASADVAAS
jgi:excisionase family DNA binding protein